MNGKQGEKKLAAAATLVLKIPGRRTHTSMRRVYSTATCSSYEYNQNDGTEPHTHTYTNILCSVSYSKIYNQNIKMDARASSAEEIC